MSEPKRLGPYFLVSKIGLGGFGVVWLAEKRSAIATTQFALKLPRGEDIDLDAFKQEAAIWLQASGHPNVLPLIDADIYEDQVVIVSEYVSDGSLASWLKHHQGKAPSPEAATEMIDGVLAGLSHLHQRRIIHRDLKPENILLQRDTPRLADFGIARLLKSTSHSAHVSGTLAYMAPEAFDGKRNEQTDVWSVGVIFYEMLAGRLPYDQPDIPSFIGAIMRNDPPPLPDSVPEVLRDIVMKALQRESANRYASATEMRQDLREAEHRLWLGGRKPITDAVKQTLPPAATRFDVPETITQPVSPQPIAPPATIRTTTPQTEQIVPVVPTLPAETLPASIPVKVKSRLLLWLVGGSVVVSLLAILTGSGLYLTWKANKSSPATISKQSPESPGLTLTGHTDAIRAVAYSPDGKTLASASSDDTIKLWDAQSGVLQRTLTGHDGQAWSVAFSPDGQTIASAADDGTLKLWDCQTGALKMSVAAHAPRATSVAFSPDGKTLASGGADKTVKLWNAQTGTLNLTLSGSDTWITSVAFSPDGKTLAGSNREGITLWNLDNVLLQRTLTGHGQEVNSIAFSPDGKTLASGSNDHTIILWDYQSGEVKQRLTQHGYWVNQVAFSRDSKLLGSVSSDWTVKLWDAQTGELKQTFTGHMNGVSCLAFSANGKTVATGSLDKTIKLWTVH